MNATQRSAKREGRERGETTFTKSKKGKKYRRSQARITYLAGKLFVDLVNDSI
jgi:hypothetical protein